MDDVEPHVARPRAAHDGVEVRAVVVERRAHVVHHARDLLDVAVEDAERVRVREHQRGDVVVDLRAQVVDVDAALVVGPDLDDLVARHRHRRRVGAVRGVGREDAVAVLAAGLVVGAREQHAGQLALGAGRGVQRDVRQAGDLCERALELPHQLQRALRAGRRLQRVQAGVARERGDALVQLRVVLHRARAERIEPLVEVEVLGRERRVVADDLGLGDLRELGRLRAAEALRQRVVLGRDVELGRDERPPAGDRLLEDGRRRHAWIASRSAATAAPSTSARRSMSARVRCSVIATSRPSSCSS